MPPRSIWIDDNVLVLIWTKIRARWRCTDSFGASSTAQDHITETCADCNRSRNNLDVVLSSGPIHNLTMASIAMRSIDTVLMTIMRVQLECWNVAERFAQTVAERTISALGTDWTNIFDESDPNV